MGSRKMGNLLRKEFPCQTKHHGEEFEENQCKRLMRLTNKLKDALPEDMRGFCNA